MHGTSQIAAKIIALRAMRINGMRGGNVDEKVQEHFDFKEEEVGACVLFPACPTTYTFHAHTHAGHD